ncbi:mucoidy inhibitor MuiA family protein [Algivirga pacifica]
MRFLIFISIFFSPSFLWAQSDTEKEVKSTIKKVTVYQKGAEINRTASVYLSKGNTTLLFKDLPSKVNKESIQAKGNKSLTIVSVSHNYDFLSDKKNSKQKEEWRQRIQVINDSLEQITGYQQVYEEEKSLLLANKRLGGDSGVNVEDLRNAANFYRSRLMEIESKRKALKRRIDQLELEQEAIQAQLNQFNGKSGKTSSTVKVVVSTKTAGTYQLDLRYTINEARWVANYDLRIDALDAPINLAYKAKVFQNTEEDWKKVKLVLSTGNPDENNTIPQLSPYYLSFNNYITDRLAGRVGGLAVNTPFRGVVEGVVMDENGEPIPGASVVIKGTTQGVSTDIDGRYKLHVPTGNNVLEVRYIGYVSQQKVINSGTMNFALQADVEQLEEVVVVGYGVQGRTRKKEARTQAVASIAPKQLVPLGISKSYTSTEFEIKMPYTIPSDNQAYDVTMVEYQVPATYQYSAVPKLSEDAYLTALIPDWTEYQLETGVANLFFEGVYKGKSLLDMGVMEDTMKISIGKDKGVAISRELQKEYAKKSTFGGSRMALKSWEITVKNNKSTSIEIALKDQVPISTDEDIKVELIDISGAEQDEDNGTLKWKLKLKPKQKKVLRVKYEVKYPSGRNLVVQ